MTDAQPPSKELIRNLRAHAEDAHDNGLTGSARTCARAADEIERLQILVTERLETFIQTAGKDRRVLADYIATHEPQPAASNQWGIDEAFKTLQLLTNGSPSATGAMSFLRSQIERLQQYVGLLERQNQKQSQTISESQRSTPLHGGGGASNEPPSGLPAPNVAALMSDLMDWASDAEDDETNNNGSSIVSAEGLRKLCYRAHAALSRASQPPSLALQRIIDTYDAYRRRGVAPAPKEYGDLVDAIESARPSLTKGEGQS